MTTLLVAVAIGALSGRGIADASSAAQRFAPLDQPALHNGHRVTDKVLSGAQPEGEESFAALRELGVKTIISVDGAKPDVARAERFGMRYVHLPIGYDGIERDEGKAIAKALAELPGPIYIHCHHGKHRSAAAVAVACVYNGMLPPEHAQEVLKTFGTGENYKGLWKAARDARLIHPAELAATKVDYVPIATIDDLAELMVRTDQHFDHLKQLQKAGWKPPADHPDLDPAHEALMVQEQLHEADRLAMSAEDPADFRRMMGESEKSLALLRAALLATPLKTEDADTAFKAAEASCNACHGSYRD